MRGGRLRMTLTITSRSYVVLFAFFKQKVGSRKEIYVAIFGQTLRRLRTAIQTSEIALINDNVLPHSAVVTQQILQQIKWDVSPDVQPRLSNE
ncbi:hypothetical protein AVEN_228577-1 [Araneus ventricosus]|uniref:Uncharacterized protein n=1 Tax=Araneus ventricosus TaxID=182803 RepID=A0A4Y2FMW4_ARAVE|nr:hypothetical protein AVEN_228577-1 [Araneus ventricosus]